MQIQRRNALATCVRTLLRLLLPFIAPALPAATDAPNTLTSEEAVLTTHENGDWVQAGFDAAQSGFNRFETQLNPANIGSLTQLWASPVGAHALYASPVVWHGKVYIGSGDGRMYAFDAATGATLWVGPQQPLFFVDSAAVGHGLVFAGSIYSTLLAYNANTGEIAWTSDLTVARASPTLDGRTLYVGSFEGRLYALDAETDRPIWSTDQSCCIYDQAPAANNGRVFQMRTNTTFSAHNAQTGQQLWVAPESSVGTLAAARDMIFFNHYPNVVGLDATTGAELWTTPVFTAATTSAPAVSNRRVFVTSSKLMALEPATGVVGWQADASSLWGPSVANGVVYASSLNGEWYAFDAQKWQAALVGGRRSMRWFLHQRCPSDRARRALSCRSG